MKSIRWLIITALTIISCFAANPARAGLTADVTYKVGVGATVTDATVTIDNAKISNFYLGELILTQSGDLGDGFMSPWSTICTDIGAKLTVGSTYTFHRSRFDSTTIGLNPKWGAGTGTEHAAQAIQNAADIFYDQSGAKEYAAGGRNYTRAEWWAALQLAVWEVLYDTGDAFDLDAGRFVVNSFGKSNIRALATSWLVTSDQRYSGDILIPLDMGSGTSRTANDQVQELLYTVTPVPEASTIIAGALLLLPFGASTLRFVVRNPHR